MHISIVKSVAAPIVCYLLQFWTKSSYQLLALPCIVSYHPETVRSSSKKAASSFISDTTPRFHALRYAGLTANSLIFRTSVIRSHSHSPSIGQVYCFLCPLVLLPFFQASPVSTAPQRCTFVFPLHAYDLTQGSKFCLFIALKIMH